MLLEKLKALLGAMRLQDLLFQAGGMWSCSSLA